VFEIEFDRAIEQNDGHRVVEVRRFQRFQLLKVLARTDLSLELGSTEDSLLDVFDEHNGIGTNVVVPVRLAAEAILAGEVSPVVDDPASRARLRCELASHTTVRITYVDGVGVESIEAVGGRIPVGQLNRLFRTPILADCYIAAHVDAERGRRWSVDAGQLTDLLSTPLGGLTEGRISLRLGGDPRSPGSPTALVRLRDSVIDAYSSHSPGHRLASCGLERASFLVDLDTARIQTAKLNGLLFFEATSQDDFLFDEVFPVNPELTVCYSCRAAQPSVPADPMAMARGAGPDTDMKDR